MYFQIQIIFKIYLSINKFKFIQHYGVSHTYSFDKLSKEQQQAYFAQANLQNVNLQNTGFSINELKQRQSELASTASVAAQTKMNSIITAANNTDVGQMQSTILSKVNASNTEAIAQIRTQTKQTVDGFIAANNSEIAAAQQLSAKKSEQQEQLLAVNINSKEFFEKNAQNQVDTLQVLATKNNQKVYRGTVGNFQQTAILGHLSRNGVSTNVDGHVYSAYAKSVTDNNGKVDVNKIMQQTQEIKYVNSSGKTEVYTVKFNSDGSHQIVSMQSGNTIVDPSKLSESWQKDLNNTFSEIGKQRQQMIQNINKAQAQHTQTIAQNEKMIQESTISAANAKKRNAQLANLSNLI